MPRTYRPTVCEVLAFEEELPGEVGSGFDRFVNRMPWLQQ